MVSLSLPLHPQRAGMLDRRVDPGHSGSKEDASKELAAMKIRSVEELLRKHPLFETMRDDHLSFLAGCGSATHFNEQTLIFQDNQPADAFFILRGGRVAIEVAAAGRDPITVETLERGDVLGWSWLFPPYRWHFTARAVEPVKAVALDAKCLREKIEGDHALGYDLMKRFCAVMTSRIHATQMQLLRVYD
jgi:CRP/FNR family cyclic AMP-dependent transcriptional regulator